jgi:hypothetical protein
MPYTQTLNAPYPSTNPPPLMVFSKNLETTRHERQRMQPDKYLDSPALYVVELQNKI